MRRASRTDSNHAPIVAALRQIRLPWPPSVNNYWRCTERFGKRAITDEAITYRKEVWLAWKQSKKPVVNGRIGVRIDAFPPDKRVRDLDNLLKSMLDALKHAGAYKDDGQIDDLRIVRGRQAKDGGVLVDMWEMTVPF